MAVKAAKEKLNQVNIVTELVRQVNSKNCLLEETCKFGEKTFKVGEEFEKSDFTDNYGRKFEKVKCECVIPPLMKCTRG
jgi:hypothetical protein